MKIREILTEVAIKLPNNGERPRFVTDLPNHSVKKKDPAIGSVRWENLSKSEKERIYKKRGYVKTENGTWDKPSKNLTEATLTDYEAIATNDFQNRHGSSPRSNVPDTIRVDAYSHRVEMIFSFHHTRQPAAESWVANYLTAQRLPYDEITSMQSGDYEDDWVEVMATIEF